MDVKTTFLFLALVNVTLGVAVLALQHGMKKSAALEKFCLAKLLQTIAWSLFYLRDGIPEVLAIPFANALLFAGIAVEAAALAQSAERPALQRLLLPASVLSIAVFSGLYLSSPDAGMRVHAAAVSLAVLYGLAGLALLLAWRGGSTLRRLVGGSSLLLATALGAHGIWSALRPDAHDEVGVLWQMLLMLPMIALYLLALINGIGFVLLLAERQHNELLRLSIADPLTGAPNRRGFFNAVAPWLALARRAGPPTSLFVFDLDHFKRINDDYGHPTGDAILKTVVDIGQHHLRESDMIGHLGSEEFAVLLPRTTLPEAAIVAERMRQAIQEMPIKTERAVLHVTASFGLTSIAPDDSMVTLFRRADDALHEAKNQGRNRTVQVVRKTNSMV